MENFSPNECSKGRHILYAIFNTGQKIKILPMTTDGENFLSTCIWYFNIEGPRSIQAAIHAYEHAHYDVLYSNKLGPLYIYIATPFKLVTKFQSKTSAYNNIIALKSTAFT